MWEELAKWHMEQPYTCDRSKWTSCPYVSYALVETKHARKLRQQKIEAKKGQPRVISRQVY